MRQNSAIVQGLLALSLLGLAGCAKLNVERKMQVGSGDVQAIIVDPPKKDQPIVVVTSTPGVPVSVYVVEEKDLDGAKQALLDGKAPAKTLAKQEKTEAANLSATVPAKSGFAVVLHNPVGGKATEATVKVTGK